MKKCIYNFINNEEGAGTVEYGLLIGTLGFAMFVIWTEIRKSLYYSYVTIIRVIREPNYP